MADNTSTIVQFFRSKGLSDAAISGILGNLQVESGFSPTAYNEGEGAIGIAQWEGGRRSALQQYAASHGGSETDLNTQLNFLWQELSTSYSGVLNQLKTVGSASEAATIWDSQYEVSSGSTRSDRINNANTFFSNGLQGGGSVSNPSGGSGPTLTDADYKVALGSLSGLLQAVPELKAIETQAISGGWSTAKFEQAIQASAWYKANNEATKQLVALQYSDPAEYKSRLANALSSVTLMANQMGVTIGAGDLNKLAMASLTSGWDQAALQHNIGAYFGYQAGAVGGQAAQLSQQLKQYYSDYGVPMPSDAVLNSQIRNVLEQGTTIDAYKQQAINAAKSMYPSLAAQLDSGLTVKDIASPYMTQMANILEIDPNNIQTSDPLIKKALQGTNTTTNGNTTSTSTPLWQFEQTLRSDPRWSQTQNARDTISSALLKVGSDFGFGPTG